MYKEKLDIFDPLYHDSNNFMYLVIGFISDKKDLKGKIESINSSKHYHSASIIASLNKMNIEKLFNSYGFNRIEALNTFGSYGIILSIPRDDVIKFIYPIDFGSPVEDFNKMTEFLNNYSLLSYDLFDMLRVSSQISIYNEIIFLGDENIKVNGIFYIEGCSHKKIINKIKELKKIVGDVPVIRIQNRSNKEINEVLENHLLSPIPSFYKVY